MMMVAGVYNPNVIKYAAPSADLSLYHRDLMYGPIIINQMESVLNLLVRDRDTREAILVIGNRSPVEMWRQPCTTSIQFLIRQGLLITIVSMRSQDLVLGLPYDLVMFGGLAQVVATELGLSLGNVTIHQGSAHVYDSTAPMVPIEHQWMSYAIQYGFFRACSEWRRELVEMCWKPAPSGITHTCWFKKDDTWIAEVA
jgi:thymidylate synthase